MSTKVRLLRCRRVAVHQIDVGVEVSACSGQMGDIVVLDQDVDFHMVGAAISQDRSSSRGIGRNTEAAREREKEAESGMDGTVPTIATAHLQTAAEVSREIEEAMITLMRTEPTMRIRTRRVSEGDAAPSEVETEALEDTKRIRDHHRRTEEVRVLVGQAMALLRRKERRDPLLR